MTLQLMHDVLPTVVLAVVWERFTFKLLCWCVISCLRWPVSSKPCSVLTLYPRKMCFHITKMHVGYNERHILIGLKLLIFLCLVGSWWYRTAALFLYGLHTWKLVTCWSFPSFKITYGRGHHLHTLYICVTKQCTSRWWSHSADESNKELLWYPELY